MAASGGRPRGGSRKGKRRRGAKPRTAPARPRRPPEPLTAAQAARFTLMKTANPPVEQTHIVERLRARGVDISRQSVGLVIRNKFVNEEVIAAFCELTGSTREQAWPDVPALTPAPADSGTTPTP